MARLEGRKARMLVDTVGPACVAVGARSTLTAWSKGDADCWHSTIGEQP